MPVPERGLELIQKYLDAHASEAELAELEQLLTDDPHVAAAFAEAAVLHASLEGHFRKQYKIDQVAALLKGDESTSPTDAASNDNSCDLGLPDLETAATETSESTLWPVGGKPTKPHRKRPVPSSSTANRWKWVAAAMLVLGIGTMFWLTSGTNITGPRIVSGQIAVLGKAASKIAMGESFEVVGQDAAVLEFPDGLRLELVTATKATLRRVRNRSVMQLETGGGEFFVPNKESYLRVQTELGILTGATGRFSLSLVTNTTEQISETETLPVPRLVVAVTQGSITIAHAAGITTLTAGQERVFVL